MKSKFLIVLIILFIIFGAFSLKVNAEDIIVEDWLPTSTGSNEKLTTIAGKILGVIRAVGTVMSIIALACIGIKYMCGSIEEKAEYKKTMLLYLIGCVMVFATTNITVILYEVGKSMEK